MENRTTLAHCWLEMKNRPDNAVAVRVRRAGNWVDLSWTDYSNDIEKIAAGLLSLKVQPQDRIAIMSNTRYEWGCTDFAIVSAGAVTVAIYPNNTAEDTAYMLQDSGATILFVESKALLAVWEKIKPTCPSVREVYVFEKNTTEKSWDDLRTLGEKYLHQNPGAVAKAALKAKPTDMATLLYTSGTTGLPKGVVITHTQAISEVSEAFQYAGAKPEDVSLSFLPYAHILGRIELWGHAWIGFTMAFAESIERVRSNLIQIRPTILVSVPRIFEKIHGAIYAQMENQNLKRKLFDWALEIGKEVAELQATRQMIPIPLLAKYEMARTLVLNKIRDAFGGRVRFAISGGAPLHPDIAKFFHASGVLILQGYGLTETTAAITVNTPYNYRFDSVGRPFGDVKLKIAEDGEILVQSKKVMKEYYKNPEATASVLKDGWFHTGDIGQILPGGDLKITDRKKDLIKTAGGKYVAPQRLEGLLQLSALIGHAVIHGDQKKYIVALIVPDRPNVEAFAKEHKIASESWEDLLKQPEIQGEIRKAVAEANSQLASWESIKHYAVLPNEFTVEGGELTPSLKIKRKVLEGRFSDKIESLYS